MLFACWRDSVVEIPNLSCVHEVKMMGFSEM